MVRVVAGVFFALLSSNPCLAQDLPREGPPLSGSAGRERPSFETMTSQELDEITVYDLEDIQPSLGEFSSNRFAAPSQEDLHRRIEELRAERRPIPVHEFLGDRIDHVALLDREPGTTVDQATARVKELLRSVLLSPDHPFHGPDLQITWAEKVFVEIKAMIRFTDGSIGALEHGGSHLVFQDSSGVFWWHRWDASFPRRVLTDENGTE